MDNNQQSYQEALKAIVDGFFYAIQEYEKHNSTKIYDGIVKSSADNNKWNVQYNGETHAIKAYNINPTIGSMVKVYVPQGNQNLAYFC